MSTVTLKKIFVEKQKQTCERLTRCGGATSSYNKKKKKIQGFSYIYDRDGPFALSLVRSPHCSARLSAFQVTWSEQVLSRISAIQGLGMVMSGLATSQPISEQPS